MTSKLIHAAIAAAFASTTFAATTLGTSTAEARPLAKNLFGYKRQAAALSPQVFGSYARGCVAGAARLPNDGETWQAMRPSRNRHWAHPDTIDMIKRLSRDGQKIGWNGLLVGDLSQPRGGPMLTGHASHQAGLDADIWLTPMPDRRLTRGERETLSATSMLGSTKRRKLDNQSIGKAWTAAHRDIIRTAAEYPEVERIFVHPAIKREMCNAFPDRPKWLRKVRAQWGHHYHFHVRLGCPEGSPTCRPQKPVGNMGCGKQLNWWFEVAYAPRPKPTKKQLAALKKKKKVKPKPRKRDIMTMRDLPQGCQVVLNASNYDGLTGNPRDFVNAGNAWAANATVPTPRPADGDTVLVNAGATDGRTPLPAATAQLARKSKKLEAGFKPAPLR